MKTTMRKEVAMSGKAVGFDQSSLRRLSDSICADVEKKVYDGTVFVVARNGEVALRGAIGFADRAGGQAMREDHVFVLLSVTKALTAVTVLQRVDRGEIRLNAPVADIIPEFGILGKQNVTLAQLLTHTGGIPAIFPPLPMEEQGNLEKVVAEVCKMYLMQPPDEAVCYSPIVAYAVLAEVVRRLDGGRRPFREIMDREVFQPLGMKDTSLGMRSDLADRAVRPVVRDRSVGLFDPDALQAFAGLIADPARATEIPAGGCVSTAADIFRFAEALRWSAGWKPHPFTGHGASGHPEPYRSHAE